MDRLSFYASRQTPFFFLIDYKKRHIFVEPIQNMQNVLFQVPGFANYVPQRASAKILAKYPIPFERYEEAFKEVQRQIHRGNTYLLNLTFPTSIECEGSLLDIFFAAKAPFKLYFQDRFVCFSPERFVRIAGDRIHTFPMKGTIDASLPDAKERILSDPKEMAEHTMVVDLLRNDLNMVASRVQVRKFRYIDHIRSHNKELLQVSSHIEGILPCDWPKRLGEIFDLLLPAGSITGTPKRSTCEIIERVEGYERGYYTGIFGYFDGKNLESGVMIRFIESQKNGFVYKSGGGITADSEAKREYQELIDKIYLPL